MKEAAEKTAAIAGDAGGVSERKMPPAPAAAKLMAENNVAVDQVSGSGKRGQVLKGDVLDALAKGISARRRSGSAGAGCPRQRARRPQPTTRRARNACA